MHSRLKKTYRQRLKDLFYRLRVHPWYQKIMMLPFSVRVVFAFFLFLFGIVGLFTPIPAGWVMILLSGAIVFGIHIVRRHSIRIFFLLRLHKLIEYIRLKIRK